MSKKDTSQSKVGHPGDSVNCLVRNIVPVTIAIVSQKWEAAERWANDELPEIILWLPDRFIDGCESLSKWWTAQRKKGDAIIIPNDGTQP